jgi:hypothetical protein
MPQAMSMHGAAPAAAHAVTQHAMPANAPPHSLPPAPALQAYPDLHSLPSKPGALWAHFQEHGFAEGRQGFWTCTEADWAAAVTLPSLQAVTALAEALPQLPREWRLAPHQQWTLVTATCRQPQAGLWLIVIP